MFSGIRFRNEQNQPVDLFLGSRGVGRDYYIKNIDGLGPAPANIQHSRYAMLDGGAFHSAKGEVRNVVLTLGINPRSSSGKTVQQIRRDLYTYLLPKYRVRGFLYDDGIYSAMFTGYVETHEPVIFSKEPEVQISILVLSPAFSAPADKTIVGLGSGPQIVPYEGDVPWGFKIKIRIMANSDWIEIRARDTHIVRIQNFEFRPWHYLEVNTVKGEKDVTYTHWWGEELGRFIGTYRVVEDWPDLRPGDNKIEVRSPVGLENPTYDITYREHYGGF